MRLHIVRHGQTDWNALRRIQGQLDSQLNDAGKQQAHERGADFIDMNLTAVYSSSSLRTRQTTALILGTRKDSVIYRDDLREVNLGVWQGLYWADVKEQYPDLVELHEKGSPLFEVEGAENTSEFQDRGVTAIESIIAAHDDSKTTDNILIVSHGDIMKTILAYYLKISLIDLHTLPPLPNCAHCIIDVGSDQRTVTTIASTPIANTDWADTPRQTR
ncbi:MAG: putative phosphoglycerate mutase [Pseudomonadales bacterium]|jgi:probable phosphoglycerate mutase